MRPDPETTNAFIYCLAVAAHRTGVGVFFTATMSNHHHTGIVDTEGRLPEFLSEEVRKVMREQIRPQAEVDAYMPVAQAARMAAVTPDTIRAWIRQGRLREHSAGRELRVRRSDLERLLAEPRRLENEPAPEELARRYLAEARTAEGVRKRHREVRGEARGKPGESQGGSQGPARGSEGEKGASPGRQERE